MSRDEVSRNQFFLPQLKDVKAQKEKKKSFFANLHVNDRIKIYLRFIATISNNNLEVKFCDNSLRLCE